MEGRGPAVMVKVALTLAPGAMGSEKVFEEVCVPWTTAFHCVLGKARLSARERMGVAEVLVKVTVVSFARPGAKVWRPGECLAEAGMMLSRLT